MDANQMLDLMRGYFVGKQPAEVLEAFASQKPTDLLKESLDVVDFVTYLEEELDREIDLQVLGEVLVNKNFGELAAAVVEMFAPAV